VRERKPMEARKLMEQHLRLAQSAQDQERPVERKTPSEARRTQRPPAERKVPVA
jgi:hypothetical protein